MRTFKALDYDMRLYGFWPSDLLVVFVVFVGLHAFLNSILTDVLVVGPLL